MVGVEQWAEIRRLCFVERRSKRAISRQLGVHHDTVTRAIGSRLLPRYVRAPAGSKLDPFKEWICERPDLLDRPGQAGGAVGDDEPGCCEPAAGEVAAELDPVLLGLPHPQPHGNRRSVAILSDPPGADHASSGRWGGTGRQIASRNRTTSLTSNRSRRLNASSR
jgi:hypothetical protein